ncbi:MAG TPA: hypothetical protein VME23_08930, partial [Terracidiphilus sp.]|nr:hypothetical protein [Terracidiphilus sp.]
ISLDTRNLGLLVFVAEKTKRNPPLNPASRRSAEPCVRLRGAACIQGGFFAFIALLTICFSKINGRRERWP